MSDQISASSYRKLLMYFRRLILFCQSIGDSGLSFPLGALNYCDLVETASKHRNVHRYEDGFVSCSFQRSDVSTQG